MYKTINGWTKKSMVEHIKKEFRGKSAMSAELGSPCLYRGPNGEKCAVGMFIPDYLYKKNMEGAGCYEGGYPFDSIQHVMPLALDQLGGKDGLQEAHDISKPDETLSDMLTWIDKNVEA